MIIAIPNSTLLFWAQVSLHTSQREDEKMGVLRTCCWCLSLRTGCILLAILEIIYQLCQVAATFKGLPSLLISAAVGCIFSDAILIFGAVKRNRTCLWAKIGYNYSAITFLSIGSVLSVINLVTIKERFSGDEDELKKLLPPVYVLIGVQLNTVVLLVISSIIVHSFVCELRDAERLLHQNGYRNNAPAHVYPVPVHDT